MTFTELEYILMIAVAVLLWRGSVLNSRIAYLTMRSDRYANFLMRIGEGKGTVIQNEEGTWEFKEKS